MQLLRKARWRELGAALRSRAATRLDEAIHKAEAIKAEVAEAAKTIDAADEKMEVIEAERTSLFNTLPNLLDPRVNDGDDEEANFEVCVRTADAHR